MLRLAARLHADDYPPAASLRPGGDHPERALVVTGLPRVAVILDRIAAPELVRLLTTMRDVGAIDQARSLARRAIARGRLDRDDMRRLEIRALVALLITLHDIKADDLVRRLADDAVSCAWRCGKDDVQEMPSVLGAAGAKAKAAKLAIDSRHLLATGSW